MTASIDKYANWLKSLDKKKDLESVRVAIRRTNLSNPTGTQVEIDRDINNPQNITEIILQIEQSGRRKRNEKDFTPLFSRTDIQVNQIELEKSPPKPPKSTEYVYKERTAERTFKKRSRTPSPPRRRRSVSHDDSREKYYRKRSRSPETFRRRRSRSKSYDFKRSDSRDRKYVRERSRTPPRDYVEYRRRSRSRTRSKERYLKRKSPSPCSSRSRRHSRSPRRRSPSPYKRRSSPHRSQRRSRTKSPPKSDSGKREQPYMYPVPFYEGGGYWVPAPMQHMQHIPGPMAGPRFMPRPNFAPRYPMMPRMNMPMNRPMRPPPHIMHDINKRRIQNESSLSANKPLIIETSMGKVIEIPRDGTVTAVLSRVDDK